MVGIPFLLIGIVLVVAGAHWFAAAVTVGWILIIFSLLPLAIVLGVLLLAALGVSVTTIFKRKRFK